MLHNEITLHNIMLYSKLCCTIVVA